MTRHCFDPLVAERFGVNAAVIYQNIVYWIEKNQANEKNFREGRYWTYNSYSAFKKLFPYLSEKQIRTALDKLIEADWLMKGNFNQNRFDQKNWYALGNSICPQGQIEETQKSDRQDPKGKSYKEDIKTKNKPNTRARGSANMGKKFVPQGERSAELEAWREALQEMGVYQLERVFELVMQDRKEGFLIPSTPPPNEPYLRKTYLELWLKEHGKTESLSA